MFMNKKFTNSLLFSAALLSSGVMSSCKDYDDDINSLNDRVAAVEASIADLQKKIAEGKWIVSFDQNQAKDGYILKLSDGSTLEIKNGANGKDGIDGTNGADGKNGATWVIDEETKEWVMIDADGQKHPSGVIAEGKPGADGNDGAQGPQGPVGPAGEPGKSPQINEEGIWEVWDINEKKYVSTGISATGTASYVVEFQAYWELHMVVADENGKPKPGEFATIILPKTAQISSLDVYSLDGNRLDAPEVTIYYGSVEGSQPVEFNGVTHQPGEILMSKSASLVAQVNPLSADASLYKFKLANSKGQEIFTATATGKNKTDGALTRAASENQGFWDLQLDVNGTQVPVYDANTAFALQTTVCGPEKDNSPLVSSAFNIKVKMTAERTNVPAHESTVTVKVGENISWEALKDLLFGAQAENLKVADFNFFATGDDQAQLNRDGVVIEKDFVRFTKASGTQYITSVSFGYLGLDGAIGTPIRMNIIAEASSEISIPAFNHKMNDGGVHRVTVDFPDQAEYLDILKDFQVTSVEYKFKNSNVTVDGQPVGNVNLNAILGTPLLSKTTVQGYEKYSLSMDFDNSKLFAEPIEATVKCINMTGTAEVKYIKFDILITGPDAYTFNRVDGYFEGDAVKAYPTVTGATKTYDLSELHTIDPADLTYVSYAAENANWFQTPGYKSKVTFTNADVNKPRNVEVSYRPFNNTNLNKTTDKFTVEFRSQIEDGNITLAEEGFSLTVDKDNKATLKATDLKFTDYNNKAYELDDARIASHKLELVGEDVSEYIKFTGDADRFINGTISIERVNQTVIPEAKTFQVKLTVTDKLNRTKVATVNVTVK